MYFDDKRGLTCGSRPCACTLGGRPLIGGHGDRVWPESRHRSGGDLLCTSFGIPAFECEHILRLAGRGSNLLRQPSVQPISDNPDDLWHF